VLLFNQNIKISWPYDRLSIALRKASESGFCMLFSLLLCLIFVTTSTADAQVVALKNNLLYDAAASANVALEVKLADRWTLGAGVGLNLWSPLKSAEPTEDLPPKWRHFLVNVEARYWFCKVFVRDFIGINAAYSTFNVAGGKNYPIQWLYKSLENTRKEGHMVAGGVFYGWSWILSPHTSFELEGGLDVGYAWYDEYDCERCGPFRENKHEFFLAPKLGVNFIWQIK